MKLGPKLEKILTAELAAGNSISEDFVGKFANCDLLVLLTHPFHADYNPLPDGVEEFTNRDSHYPIGKGYDDIARREMLLAPFS